MIFIISVLFLCQIFSFIVMIPVTNTRVFKISRFGFYLIVIVETNLLSEPVFIVSLILQIILLGSWALLTCCVDLTVFLHLCSDGEVCVVVFDRSRIMLTTLSCLIYEVSYFVEVGIFLVVQAVRVGLSWRW